MYKRQAKDSQPKSKLEKKPAVKDKTKNVNQKRSRKLKGDVFSGVFAGLAVFVLFFAGGIFAKSQIVQLVPASKVIYQVMKFDIPIVGEGLVFDRVEAVWVDSKLSVSGQVINLLTSDTVMPSIQLQFLGKDDSVLDTVDFSIQDTEVLGESAVSFSHDFQAMKDVQSQTDSVRLAFNPVE